MKSKSKKKNKWYPYKSKLEQDFAKLMQASGKKVQYEADRIKFIKESHYVPDWKIRKNVYIETKGYMAPSNRTGLLTFREQHPHITILLCFQNSKNRLNSRSKITYAEWAEKNNFKWCDFRHGIPEEWWNT